VSRWGNIRTVRMCSLLTPSASSLTVKKEVLRYKCAILDALELEKHIRRRRGWIVVEHDEWAKYDGLWTDAGGGPTAAEIEGWYREAKVGRGCANCYGYEYRSRGVLGLKARFIGTRNGCCKDLGSWPP